MELLYNNVLHPETAGDGGTYAAMWLDKISDDRLRDFYQDYIPNLVDDFHVTTTFSKKVIPDDQMPEFNGQILLNWFHFRYANFGDNLVLKVKHRVLNKLWQEAINVGADWSHPTYEPHITLSMDRSVITKLPPVPTFTITLNRFKIDELKD